MTSYKDFQRDLAPAWLQKKRGKAWLEGHGEEKDGLVSLLADAVKAHLAKVAPEDALVLLAVERGFERFKGERLDAFRARVLGAFEFWEFAGTRRGMETVLKQLGYRPYVAEHWKEDRTKWSEFSIYLFPDQKALTSWAWGTGAWGDGRLWGLDVGADEPPRVRGVIDKMKPAHSKLRAVTYVKTGQAWGDGHTWGQGTWGGIVVPF